MRAVRGDELTSRNAGQPWARRPSQAILPPRPSPSVSCARLTACERLLRQQRCMLRELRYAVSTKTFTAQHACWRKHVALADSMMPCTRSRFVPTSRERARTACILYYTHTRTLSMSRGTRGRERSRAACQDGRVHMSGGCNSRNVSARRARHSLTHASGS